MINLRKNLNSYISIKPSLFLCSLVLTFFSALAFLLINANADYLDGGKNQYGKFRAVSPQRFIALTLPKFGAPNQTKLADSEWVIGIKIGNDARCYPVRQMWYHHIVNDEIGGQKLSLTY
jgi:hypothetical protein